MELILASRSAIRQRILRDARLPFRVLTGADAEPDPDPDECAASYVSRCAEAKARACAREHAAELDGDIILGCDQVVRFRGAILRKLTRFEDAADRLMALQEEPHALVNGLAFLRDGALVARRVCEVTLQLRPLPRELIEAYLRRERPLSSVACYFLEGEGIKLMSRLDGDIFSALGLPVRDVTDLLLELGFPIFPRPGAQVILILEDEAPRVTAMRAVLKELAPEAELVIVGSAPEARAWLAERGDAPSLISLDHDLIAPPGSGLELGTGRDVAETLAQRPPVCPVIVHSANPYGAQGMMTTLEMAGWSATRVVPHSDLAWIASDWRAEVAALLSAPEGGAA